MKKYISPTLGFEAIRQKENISLEVDINDIYGSSTATDADYDYEY